MNVDINMITFMMAATSFFCTMIHEYKISKLETQLQERDHDTKRMQLNQYELIDKIHEMYPHES